MKGLMVSVMANVTNEVNTANMAASSNVAAVNAVDANNHKDNHSDNHSNKRNNKQNNKCVKIGDLSTVSTESVFSPPSTWPAWMQRAMMDNGRVAFRGSKIGIKIGIKLHNEPCSLTEMIKIIEAYQKRLYPDMKQSDFRRKPTPSYLRRHCTCIAFYRAEEGSRADCDFSVILYDNGWFEYWGTGRRTTLYLPDCKEFIYKYNLAIDEIDKTTVDQSVLGNTEWYTVATLFAEERITQNMVGYGGNASCDDGGAGVGAGTGAETDEGQPISESKKVTEIVGAAHIPTPEERLLKEERRAEMKATAKLTDKQAEVYKLHFEYEYSLERTGEMIGIPCQTAASRLTGIRERFSEEIRAQTGENVKEYFNDGTSNSAKANNTEGINGHKKVKDTSGNSDDDENFEDEIDDIDEIGETDDY